MTTSLISPESSELEAPDVDYQARIQALSTLKRKLIYKKTADLVPYAMNSRTHTDEQIDQIANSMVEFGFTNPVLLDEEDGIIAGHGRILAAQQLNLDEVPTICLEGLTAAQKKAYVIADNQLALNAGWDLDNLKLEVESLDELGFDIELLGFDDDFLKDLLEDIPDGLTDPDDVPDVPEEPISVLGDIWILGNHRVMCGDSTIIDSVEKLMDGQLADQFVTDPPYNVAYEGKTKDALTIKNDSMADSTFREFLTDSFTAANAVMKDGAVFYIWHADSEGYNFRGACVDTGWKVRQCLIWNKNSMVMGRQDYHWKHEPCLYGWKDGAGHLWNTDRKQVTVLTFDRPSRSSVHPTMKPVDLIEYQVLNNTKGQDIVLDLFGGSGSTLIACQKNNRHSRLMELDPKYVDVIVQRWQDYTGETAVHENGETFTQSKEE